MLSSAASRRPRRGLLCLSIAAFMLLGGQTVFDSYLTGLGFLLYWLVCFFFTIASIGVAILDLRTLNRQSHSLREQIIDESFSDLEGAEGENDANEKDSLR